MSPAFETREQPLNAVVLENVEKTFDGGKVPACAGICLNIGTGEFFTLLGPSGCGKTTLLRLIAGFIFPEKGVIHIHGQAVTFLPPEQRRVGMVFQNYALFPFLNVADNIAYGLKAGGKSASERREIVRHYMALIGLEGYERRRISELSGGEQQRVALARSLAPEPDILLLDEPLSNLDARMRDKMRLEIKSLQQKLGITTIFVTHDQTEALTMSDRIAVLNKGCIVQIGTPAEVYRDPRTVFAAGFIGDTNLFETAVADGLAVLDENLALRLADASGTGKFVSIRPQDIDMFTEFFDGLNTFKGQVIQMQLNGRWIEYSVRVSQTLFRVHRLNRHLDRTGVQIGDHVYLSIDPDAVSVLAS